MIVFIYLKSKSDIIGVVKLMNVIFFIHLLIKIIEEVKLLLLN